MVPHSPPRPPKKDFAALRIRRKATVARKRPRGRIIAGKTAIYTDSDPDRVQTRRKSANTSTSITEHTYYTEHGDCRGSAASNVLLAAAERERSLDGHHMRQTEQNQRVGFMPDDLNREKTRGLDSRPETFHPNVFARMPEPAQS